MEAKSNLRLMIRIFFNDTIEYFKESRFEILELEYDLGGDRSGNIITEYENKWRNLGVKICYIRVKLNK